MSFFCKRRRKLVAPFVLVLWLVGLAVSVAHACGLDDYLLVTDYVPTTATVGHGHPCHGTSSACEKFCAEDLPLTAKLKAVQDFPAGEPLVPPVIGARSAQLPRLSWRAPACGPPPSIPLSIRLVRLAL